MPSGVPSPLLVPAFYGVVASGNAQPLCASGGGTPNRWMRSKIAANKSRGTATSAIWKTTYLEWVATFAPILISLSRGVVN